jgi:uncharacterized protein (DUF4415 family)
MKRDYDFSQDKRGLVAPQHPGKVRITIRIDADILNWFRERVSERGGGNYQTMMNEALRVYIQSKDKTLEETIRKVIREELRAQV